MSQPFGPVPAPWYSSAAFSRPPRPFSSSVRGMTVTTSPNGSIGIGMPSSPLVSPTSDASFLESPGIECRLWELQDDADAENELEQMRADIEMQQNLGMDNSGSFGSGMMSVDANGMMASSIDEMVNMEMPEHMGMGMGMGMEMPMMDDPQMDTPMSMFNNNFHGPSSFIEIEPPPEPLRLL